MKDTDKGHTGDGKGKAEQGKRFDSAKVTADVAGLTGGGAQERKAMRTAFPWQ